MIIIICVFYTCYKHNNNCYTTYTFTVQKMSLSVKFNTIFTVPDTFGTVNIKTLFDFFRYGK
jgi:hypothetical protein